MATWTIDPDVRRIATRFTGASASFPKLIASVIRAEGNIIRAVQCSEPGVTAKEKSLEITARSAAHAMSDFIYADPELRARFIDAWAKVWAPVGADNDPTGLNKNWPTNVKANWK